MALDAKVESLAGHLCGAGMERATVSHLENGQIDNPANATMTRYTKALGKKVHVSLAEAGQV